MTNEERAARYVILFDHYGDQWRYNVPVDATVKGDTVTIGGVLLQRASDGRWSVTS
jgi:hypothetical protein